MKVLKIGNEGENRKSWINQLKINSFKGTQEQKRRLDEVALTAVSDPIKSGAGSWKAKVGGSWDAKKKKKIVAQSAKQCSAPFIFCKEG